MKCLHSQAQLIVVKKVLGATQTKTKMQRELKNVTIRAIVQMRSIALEIVA